MKHQLIQSQTKIHGQLPDEYGPEKGEDGIPPVVDNTHYIYGKVEDENGQVANAAMVIIRDSTGTILGTHIIDDVNGYYFEIGTDIPIGNDYTLEFIYGIGKYNWQDYELDSGYLTENRTNLNNMKIDNKLYNKYDSIKNKTDLIQLLAGSPYADYAIIAISNPFSVDGTTDLEFNLKLKPRTPIKMSVEKTLVKAKVTLADGQVLREEDYSGETELQESVPAYWYIDDEIMYGATIQLEYEIKIQSDKDLTEVEVLDYLSYDNSTLLFDKNAEMLSDSSMTNNDWEVITKTDVETSTGISGLKEGATYLKSNPSGTNSNILTLHLIASKLVTPSDTDLTYDNIAEVISYKNATGQIAKDTAGNYLVPGNYNPDLAPNEADTDKAKQFIITKPTGGKTETKNKIPTIFERMKR